MLQRDLLAAGRLVVVDGLLELGKVVQPLLAALRAQRCLIAAFVEDCGEHLGDRAIGIGRCETLNELHELVRFGALHDFMVEIFEQRVVQGTVVRLRVLLEELHAALSHVSFGRVDNAAERQIVLIRNHAQVRKRVLDLHSREELHAAVDRVGQLRFQEHFLHLPRQIMRAVQHRHVLIRHALLGKLVHLPDNPFRFFLGVSRMVAQHRSAVRLH